MGWANYHIEALEAGKVCKFRPKGNSMSPKIESGQLVTLVPPFTPEYLKVGDIVLVTVKGNQYLHLISAIKDGQFQISNNKGYVNGWTTGKQIHGKLVMIEP